MSEWVIKHRDDEGEFLIHYGRKGMEWGKNKKKKDYSSDRHDIQVEGYATAKRVAAAKSKAGEEISKAKNPKKKHDPQSFAKDQVTNTLEKKVKNTTSSGANKVTDNTNAIGRKSNRYSLKEFYETTYALDDAKRRARSVVRKKRK